MCLSNITAIPIFIRGPQIYVRMHTNEYTVSDGAFSMWARNKPVNVGDFARIVSPFHSMTATMPVKWERKIIIANRYTNFIRNRNEMETGQGRNSTPKSMQNICLRKPRRRRIFWWWTKNIVELIFERKFERIAGRALSFSSASENVFRLPSRNWLQQLLNDICQFQRSIEMMQM